MQLPTILSRFELKYIYNADDFFYKGLLRKAIELKTNKFVGGKSKNCVVSSYLLLNLQGSF